MPNSNETASWSTTTLSVSRRKGGGGDRVLPRIERIFLHTTLAGVKAVREEMKVYHCAFLCLRRVRRAVWLQIRFSSLLRVVGSLWNFLMARLRARVTAPHSADHQETGGRS